MADPPVDSPHVRGGISRDTSRPQSFERFPAALKSLMEERQLSYRQVAYKTKLSAGYLNHLTKGARPVPAVAVIETIAGALRVEPDYFLEYRLHQLVDFLEGSVEIVDALYAILLRGAPVSEQMRDVLETPES